MIAVLSPEGGSAAELAGRMGKRKEEGKYYRKSGDRMITILVPGPSILEAAEAVSASDFFYLVVRDLTREAAELALLAEASGRPGLVLAPDPERFSSLLRGFRISGMAGKFEPREPSTPDLGFALVDSAFIVRGVGPVALGITFTPISVHDELELLPSGKRASVRSIQVLDEDQGSIGPGVRYGVSLRGVEERDLEGCYALARPGAPLRGRCASPAGSPWRRTPVPARRGQGDQALRAARGRGALAREAGARPRLAARAGRAAERERAEGQAEGVRERGTGPGPRRRAARRLTASSAASAWSSALLRPSSMAATLPSGPTTNVTLLAPLPLSLPAQYAPMTALAGSGTRNSGGLAPWAAANLATAPGGSALTPTTVAPRDSNSPSSSTNLLSSLVHPAVNALG